VYVRPEQAWGLQVWRTPPPAELVQRSLAEYDAFYAEAHRVLERIVEREGSFVVFDLHSYNHRRTGPRGPFDAQTKHPDINVGTGTMHRARWAPLVDRMITELRNCDDLGRQLDVRENVKFMGGNFSRWIHETFPETGCSIAIELKKFFMDEWSGQLYQDMHDGIGRALASAARAVCEELRRLRPVKAIPEAPQAKDAVRATDYGHFLAGVWRCDGCGWQTFPRLLMQQAALPPFRCQRCDDELSYHE
jgi:N-formylglutamate deformylase